MKIITKRISKIQSLKLDSHTEPYSLRVTLTEELKDMGIDLVNEKLSVELVQDGKVKKIIIQKLEM